MSPAGQITVICGSIALDFEPPSNHSGQGQTPDPPPSAAAVVVLRLSLVVCVWGGVKEMSRND